MLLEISGEITPERMKGWSQSKNHTQLWMGMVLEARFDAVKSNIAEEPGLPELDVMVTPAAFPCKASAALRSGRFEISSPFT